MNLASLPGVVLDGKYRIERQLGRGGMGAVFRGIHLGTTRTVAVKVIVPQLAGEDEFLLRFHREAEAAGRLRHPNVVNVTDFGSTVVGHEQLAYLVMEYLDGQNLSDFLKKNPHPAADEILDIVDQVAFALDAAHESGIIHRDLKPDNIWLQPNHRGGFNVKVLDFGIAKLHNPVGTVSADATAVPRAGLANAAPPEESEPLLMASAAADPAETVAMDVSAAAALATPSASPSAGSRMTNALTLETTVGSVLGTPSYMAPEQCLGANVEAGADIYSLSVIVYQMFCGCLPFEAKSLRELLEKQIGELPTPPVERDPGISKRVSETILGGLAKAPAARPPSAMAFASQIRAGSEGELKLLADGKVVANNHGRSFFPLLLACFAPYIPIMGALYLVARAVTRTALVPAGLVAGILQILVFGVLFFLSQVYKAGSTLLLNDAAAAGHFQHQWRPQFVKLVHSFRSLVATHLRNTFDLRPRSFLSSQIWPVVWAAEGLSGDAALTRAADLAGEQPASAAALAARHLGILLTICLFVPLLFVIPAGLGGYVRALTGPASAITWFAILYPSFLTVMVFRFYGPAFFFLYVSSRRCRGEVVNFSLPTASRQRRSRRAASVRPATFAWLLLPLLALVVLLYQGIRSGNPRLGLFDAASSGRTTATLRALDSGLSVDSSDLGGRTPLMHAVAGGNLELVRELVARHAQVNAQNSNGDTALMVALWNRRTAEAEMLIASGANVQLANDEGRTALFAAAMHGDSAMCKLLLARGADRTHRDQIGKSAIEYAREEGYSDVVAQLSAPMPH